MNYTVIVAEDEELLLNNLVHKIEKADPDFQVIGTAQTGAQALSLVEQMSPDVVFTDIKMPVMDGITLLTRIRDQFPFTKFVITSGFSDFEYAKKAITLKVSDYLLKPVDPDELQNVLLKIKQELQIKRDDYETVFAPGASCMSPGQIAELLKNFMVQNYAEDINLNLIAGTMNYSPSYLTKIFCQVYDCTPTKYLINLRMSHAQKLLIHEPSLSVKQIGEMCGYYISELQTIPEKMQKVLEDKERIQWFAAKYANAHDVFFVGRGIDYAVCLEGSLKLKEISYIHSEAYAAGELKHGTISLIEQGTLVIGVLTQSGLYEKTVSNMLECKSRGSYLMGLTTYGKYEIEDQVNFTVYVPKVDERFVGSLAVIPLQLLGYYVSVAKGLDVDKPRNLAKSVTVE